MIATAVADGVGGDKTPSGVTISIAWPRHSGSPGHSRSDGSEPVAHAVDLSWWSDKGELTVQGVTYTARREGVMSGAFVLESTAGVVARATKPSSLRRLLIVEHSGRQYTLRATSSLRREFILLVMARHVSDPFHQTGSSRDERTWISRRHCRSPVRVFIIWLTVMLWKHDEAAAGAAAVG